MSKDEKTVTPLEGAFVPLKVSNVALLTTFRRNGQGVDTPVGITIIGENVYFTTPSDTGKVKRIANNPLVRLAPFTKMGMKVIGPTVEGRARRLSDQEADELYRGRLSLWGRLWLLIYKLQKKQKVYYEISPSPMS